MEKTTSFFIQKLDIGYILTDKGKTQAISLTQEVKEHLAQRFLKEIERFSALGVSNMSITISVDENTPTCIND